MDLQGSGGVKEGIFMTLSLLQHLLLHPRFPTTSCAPVPAPHPSLPPSISHHLL